MKFATSFQHELQLIENIPEIIIEVITSKVEEIIEVITSKIEEIKIEEVIISTVKEIVEVIIPQIQETKIEEVIIPIVEEIIEDEPKEDMEVEETIEDEVFSSIPEVEIMDEDIIPDKKTKTIIPIYDAKKNKRKSKFGTLKQASELKPNSSTKSSSDKSFSMDDVYQEFDDIPDEFTK